MNKHLVPVKNFVRNHKTAIAVATTCVVTTAVVTRVCASLALIVFDAHDKFLK